jgi:hypothetical protein
MVAAAPSSKAAPDPTLVTCTVNRSHWLTTKLAVVDPQQLPGFGPVIVTLMPVLTKVTPQSVLLNIVPVIDCAAVNGSSRILKTKPVMVDVCAITTFVRVGSGSSTPSPKKLLLGSASSEAK